MQDNPALVNSGKPALTIGLMAPWFLVVEACEKPRPLCGL